MSDDLDRLSRELADVLDRLNALPRDAFAERYELLTKQDELREEASEFRDELDIPRSASEVEAELESLRHMRNHLLESRIGFATSKGGSNQGPSSGAWVKLGAAAKGGAHLDRIHARISELEDILARDSDV